MTSMAAQKAPQKKVVRRRDESTAGKERGLSSFWSLHFHNSIQTREKRNEWVCCSYANHVSHSKRGAASDHQEGGKPTPKSRGKNRDTRRPGQGDLPSEALGFGSRAQGKRSSRPKRGGEIFWGECQRKSNLRQKKRKKKKKQRAKQGLGLPQPAKKVRKEGHSSAFQKKEKKDEKGPV